MSGPGKKRQLLSVADLEWKYGEEVKECCFYWYNWEWSIYYGMSSICKYLLLDREETVLILIHLNTHYNECINLI